MRRLHGVLTAIGLVGLATQAGAADITHVATGGEHNNPFEVDLTVRWDRFQERATITHEAGTAAAGVPGGVVGEAERLDYQRTSNAIVPRIAVGISHDLELHAEMPYVLGDETSWWYGTLYGNSSQGTSGSWTIANPGITPDGQPCASPCPALFPADPKQTVYKGGRAGDLTVGITWGIFNQKKDGTGPSWIVGLDATLPTAQLYDPAKDRSLGDWSSPYQNASKPGPFGEKIWKWDLYTAVSRRIGAVEPYFKAHAQAQFASSATYSNCDNVSLLYGANQVNANAPTTCGTYGSAGAQLPWILGATFGSEVIAFEDPADSLAIDLRLYADYRTSSRFYNELTDMNGKINETEGYAEAGGLLGLYLKASRHVTLKATASLATRTPHWLTGDTGTSADPAQTNPNFDWRYDAPGRRFRISEVSVFALSFVGLLQF
jgi:hypothetical protein